MFQIAYACQKATLGDDHDLTIGTAQRIAEIYELRGMQVKAEYMYRRLIDILVGRELQTPQAFNRHPSLSSHTTSLTKT